MFRFLAFAWTALLLAPGASNAEDLPPPTRISPATWAWIGPYGSPTRENGGFRMNMGFVVGDKAVAVIDSGYTEEMAGQMLAAVKAITSKPVRYLVNTNSQPHRFMGNATFEAAGAEAIAAAEAAARMKQDGGAFREAIEQTLAKPKGSVRVPLAPRRLIAEGKREILDLGGVTLEVVHAGTSHTAGSLIVNVAPDDVTFAGDILYGGRLPAVLSESHIKGWISAYQRLESLGSRTLIPGHGTPGPLRAFDHSTRDYLRALKDHMDREAKAGTGIDSAVESLDASPWRSLANFSELARRNAYNAYLESESDF